MNNTEFKKTLFIATYAPPLLAGAPRIMANLLASFPPESYTILTSFYNIDNLSAKIGTWLPGEYVFYDNPSASKLNRQEQETKPEEAITNPIVRLKKFLRKSFLFPMWVKTPLSAVVKMDLIAKLKRFLKRNQFVKTLLGAPLILGQIPLIIRAGVRVVHEQNIELLTGFSDYGPALVGTYYIHKTTKVPFHLYMFDVYKGNFFPLTGNLLATIFEPKLFKAATKIVVNNAETRDFYLRRYGDKIANKLTLIYNATDPAPYLPLQTPITHHQPPYNIVFTGNVYWAQAESIKNLVKAIDQINDIDIRLKLYSPNPPEYLKAIGINSPKIDYSVAPGSEMPRIQSEADILFVPLAWHTKSPTIINTATPGKLTDFLIASRPMLVHAPAESHLARYAKENNFAMVVDTESITDLQTAIRKLIAEPELSQQLVQNAKNTFFANHDIQKNVSILQTLLRK
ncbi:glycosyltransferase [Patescibacteria group bacterium]|nr:glycosyltransferase [Patescibacteria group bacterium]